MLEGLEVSEVWLSKLFSGIETFRLDSEYHTKEYEAIETFIRTHQRLFSKFIDWNVSIDCSAFYPGVEPLYGRGNIPLIRVQNVKDTIEYDNCVKLPQLDSSFETLKIVNKGDIVITKGGSIGYVGYVTEKAYASRDLIFINSSSLTEKDQVYLYLYLSTQFAFKQLIRSSSQCAQPHLTITLIKNFDIFIPSENLKNKCFELFNDSIQKALLSKTLFSEAEDLLLKELGLFGWNFNSDNTSIKRFIDFIVSGRLDAEYYLPKYDEIETKVKDYKNGYKQIKDYFTQNKDVSDCSKPEYYYIEIGDVNINNGLAECNLLPTENLPDNAKRVLRKNDLLVSKVRPYRGAVAIVNEDYDNLIGSGAFTVLREKGTYRKEVLQVLLRTPIYKEWLCKWSVGSSYPLIKDEDILNLPIPNIPEKTQQSIADYVQKSVSLRQQAKQLLEDAKLKVETAITGGG